MRALWLILVPGLIALLAVGCSQDEEVAATTTAPASGSPTATAGVTPSPTAAAPATGTATPTAAPTSIPGGTLTYSDAAFGYSFDYPASWHFSPPASKGSSAILYSYDPATAPGIGGPFPKDKLKAMIRVAEGVDEPVEQWLIDSRAGQPPVTILSTSATVLGGLNGVNEVVQDEGGLHSGYYIPLGQGRLFIVGSVPADSELWQQFEAVLNSVRFPS